MCAITPVRRGTRHFLRPFVPSSRIPHPASRIPHPASPIPPPLMTQTVQATFSLRGMAPLLQVFDMPASLAFYRDALGFAITGTNVPEPPFDWVLLERDGVQLMLNTA